MDKGNKTKLVWGIIIVLAIAAALYSVSGVGGEYDDFAECTADAGAKMYGAFWCPHCSDQKAMFGRSVKHINYIECSNSDRSQNELCTAAGIQSYPTWEFSDGSRVGGVLSLQQLSQRTGCPL